MACVEKKSKLNEFFLELHCEKNEDGTRNLVLWGREMDEKLGRRLIDSDLSLIVIFLRSHPEMVALEFPYNRITNCGLSTLADYLLERPLIKHLNLIGNNIDALGLKYLETLKDGMMLHSLRLTGNKIGDEGGKILSKLLYKNSPLRYLDLSDTHQTLSGLAYILTALMQSRGGTQNLEYIDIGRPLPAPYHQVNDGHAAEFLGQVLQDNKSLKEIHVQQFQFDFRDMEILLEGLFANNTLICLDLNNNNIADDGVDYLCKYLKTTPSLECLMIGANNITDLGALSLSHNLPYSQIKLLDISNNHITDEGMINIFYTIEKTVKMRGLFMWGNTMTHKSLVVLQRLYHTKKLDPKYCDVNLYCADKEFHAAWNYEANRYTQRFYCVFNYSDQGKLKLNPRPPMEKPPIYFKYHVDNKDIGFPMCEWTLKLKDIKYIYPM